MMNSDIVSLEADNLTMKLLGIFLKPLCIDRFGSVGIKGIVFSINCLLFSLIKEEV